VKHEDMKHEEGRWVRSAEIAPTVRRGARGRVKLGGVGTVAVGSFGNLAHLRRGEGGGEEGTQAFFDCAQDRLQHVGTEWGPG
jgi:hypothetical protein